jgi:DNA-binding PadR family transcriptional regulator
MSRADDNFDRFARHQWHRFEAMARRGFGGWGHRPGPGGMGGPGRGGWGDFGDSFRIGRMMAAGDLRLIALYFIEQQPRHGYDLIKAIEDKTGGIYVPSPGVVYPALTFLEEANYVTSTAEGNKRLYTITDEGRAHLSDNRAAVETTLEYLGRIGEKAQTLRSRWEDAERRFSEGFGRSQEHDHAHEHGPAPDRDMDGVIPDVNDARRDLKDAIKSAKKADPETQRRIAAILVRAAEDVRRETNRAPDHDVDL